MASLIFGLLLFIFTPWVTLSTSNSGPGLYALTVSTDWSQAITKLNVSSGAQTPITTLQDNGIKYQTNCVSCFDNKHNIWYVMVSIQAHGINGKAPVALERFNVTDPTAVLPMIELPQVLFEFVSLVMIH
eukprot:967639_1